MWCIQCQLSFTCNRPRQIPNSAVRRSGRFGVFRGSGAVVGGSYLQGMNDSPTSTQVDGLERLLTVTELSEYLGIPVATLYDWRTEGVGPKAVRLGRALRYPVSWVRTWVEE